MNNEETIIAQPQGNQRGNQQRLLQQEEEKNNSRKTIATAAAAAVGGATLGAAATAAIMHGDVKAEEVNAQVPEHNDDASTGEAQVEEQVETEPSETVQTEALYSSTEQAHVATHQVNAQPIDYTDHGGADPVVTVDEVQPEAQAIAAVDDVEPQVEVLGIYERYTDEGIHQTAAVITDGTEVGAVFDTTGDGYADTYAEDLNHNSRIDEGEITDISGQGIPMSDINETYIAQQQMEQQQMDDMAQLHNASYDGLPDYTHDANFDA